MVGEWAGDCSGDFRLGYRLGTEGELVAYMVNKGVASDFGKPALHQIDADFFSLDFKDGAPPIVWKKAADTIQPWSQGEGESAPIKSGIRDGQPTPTFHRCR